MSRTVDESYAGSVLVAVRRRSVARRIKDLLSALAVTSATDNPAQLTQTQKRVVDALSVRPSAVASRSNGPLMRVRPTDG